MDEPTFTCAACHGTFVCGWSEEEAEAEYRTLFPDSAASSAPRDVVCDDCHKKMMAEYPPEVFEAEERAMHAAREYPGISPAFASAILALAPLLAAALNPTSERPPIGILSAPKQVDPPRIALADRPRKHDRNGVIPPKALRRRDWN